MTQPETAERPALALRVGITGTRTLDPAQMPRLAAQVRAMLALVQQQMRLLAAQDAGVARAYRHPPGEAPVVTLRFISPLARGADRLAAREALALGYNLHVPMPFPQFEYEMDFKAPDDLAEFRALFAQAGEDWLALDGVHGAETDRAYEAVGRYVVRHCDILIAIWDDRHDGGRGGTGDIVHYAARAGVPICWLHAAEDRAPCWIASIHDLWDLLSAAPHAADAAPSNAEVSLCAHLQTLIPPPRPCRRHDDGPMDRLARLGQDDDVSPAEEHFSERPRKRRWVWQAYAAFIRCISGRSLPWTAPRRPDDPVARYWFDLYQPADARAGDYAARYRSIHVWVFFFGALALLFGTSALLFSLWDMPWPLLHMAEWMVRGFALLELLMLLLILWLVCIGKRGDWHEHAIEYRLLAELYRKQQTLAPLGWALPINAARSLAAAGYGAPERGAWVAWLFAAEQRAAPLPRGELAHVARGAVLEQLIAEQQAYHLARAEMAERASRRLERYGEFSFIGVLVCVAAKLILGQGLQWHDAEVLLAFLATILPALPAAFVSIRSFAELRLLAEQSHHMAIELERSQRRLQRLNLQRPLVSQEIGAEAALVATLMLQDLDGWARLFRVKGMELA